MSYYIKVLETDYTSQFGFLEEDDTLFRTPISCTLRSKGEEFMPLRTFLEIGPRIQGVMALVCIKAVSHY
jgi:hypothetical protein